MKKEIENLRCEVWPLPLGEASYLKERVQMVNDQRWREVIGG